jgi:hypothetical protein
MSFRQEDFIPYEPLTEDERECEITNLLTFLFEYVAPAINCDPEIIDFNQAALNEIVEMVNKRYLYFKVFHKGMEMGEINQVALQCYWILKLKPFFIINQSYSTDINAVFAFALMLATAIEVSADEISISENVYKTILHSFEYHELTKEAVMDITWLLVKNPKTEIRTEK